MARLIKLALLFAFLAVGSAMNSERKIKMMEATLRSGRIMGGSEAAPGQFPHQVSLQTNARSHFCGGSILTDDCILTAAHCTFGETSSSFIVALGSNLQNQLIAYKVDHYDEHPEYDDDKLFNDVSIIHLAEDINFGQLAKPIPLVDRLITSGSVLISGWGRVSPTGAIPQELRWISTNVVPRSECERLVPGIPNPDTFCVFNARSVGVCFGDSGGPLIVDGPDGPQQVGVTSFVIGTCGAGYPDGFASVDYHREWILENIEHHD